MLKRILNKVKYYNIYFKVKRNLNKGKLIVVNDSDRGIGKTTILKKLCLKYDIPIIVSSVHQKEFFKKECITAYSASSLNKLRGKRFPNGVIIEEGVAESSLKDLQELGVNIRTGFYFSRYLTR